jgi:hypothetical protein
METMMKSGRERVSDAAASGRGFDELTGTLRALMRVLQTEDELAQELGKRN